MGNPDNLQQLMKEFSRSQIYSIWQRGEAGIGLNDEEMRLYNVLREHPENTDLWEHLDKAKDEEIVRDGVNVILHVIFHGIIENQLAEDNPPAVRQVLRELLQKGAGRHEAIHALANALVPEIFQMMHYGRPFDEQNYLRELRKISLTVPHRQKKK